jgi:hypothetical protein
MPFFIREKRPRASKLRLREENAAAFDAALKREKLIRCYQLLNYLTSLYYKLLYIIQSAAILHPAIKELFDSNCKQQHRYGDFHKINSLFMIGQIHNILV